MVCFSTGQRAIASPDKTVPRCALFNVIISSLKSVYTVRIRRHELESTVLPPRALSFPHLIIQCSHKGTLPLCSLLRPRLGWTSMDPKPKSRSGITHPLRRGIFRVPPRTLYGGGWRSALLHRLVSPTLGMFGAALCYHSTHQTVPVCFAPVLFWHPPTLAGAPAPLMSHFLS